VRFSRLQRRVVRWKSTDVSEDSIASIFIVEEETPIAVCIFLISCSAYSSIVKMEMIRVTETSVDVERST
jgi:hypothetical protein